MKYVVAILSVFLFSASVEAACPPGALTPYEVAQGWICRQVKGFVVASSSYNDGRYKVYLDTKVDDVNLCDNPDTLTLDEGMEWISTPQGGAGLGSITDKTVLGHPRRKIGLQYKGLPGIQYQCDSFRNVVTYAWGDGCYVPNCWWDDTIDAEVCWDNPPGRLACPGD